MKPFLAFLFLIVMAALGFGQTVPDVRFTAVEIIVDSADEPLAAYQLEFRATAGNVKIVGIEGGDSRAFREPPHYDPKAMQHERVIIAAFSTASVAQLPKGATRVATIHVEINGRTNPQFALKLHTAAGNTGEKLPAKTSFRIKP